MKETTGRTGIPSLCNLGSPYNLETVGFIGRGLKVEVLKYLRVSTESSNTDFNIFMNWVVGFRGIILKESEDRNCLTLSIYLTLSKTTTQLPSSAFVTRSQDLISF